MLKQVQHDVTRNMSLETKSWQCPKVLSELNSKKHNKLNLSQKELSSKKAE